MTSASRDCGSHSELRLIIDVSNSSEILRLNNPNATVLGCVCVRACVRAGALEPHSQKYLCCKVNRGKVIALNRRALKAVYVMPSAQAVSRHTLLVAN